MSVDIEIVPRYKTMLSKFGDTGYVTRAVNTPLIPLRMLPTWSICTGVVRNPTSRNVYLNVNIKKNPKVYVKVYTL